MTSKLSKPSNESAAKISYEIDPLNPINPPRTRITTAWEIMLAAVDELPATDGIVALTEIYRRAHDATITRVRRLARQARQKDRHNETDNHP